MINKFYCDILSASLTKMGMTEISSEETQAILVNAINMLPSDDQQFISLLKPFYSDTTIDPYGNFSLNCVKTTAKAYNLSFVKVSKRKQDIYKQLKRNCIQLLNKK